MGERAHQAYEQDRRESFRALPWRTRWKANLAALAFTAAVAFLVFLAFVYPMLSAFGEG